MTVVMIGVAARASEMKPGKLCGAQWAFDTCQFAATKNERGVRFCSAPNRLFYNCQFRDPKGAHHEREGVSDATKDSPP